MNNKLFIFLVIILSGAIVASLVALFFSVINYNKPVEFDKPSVLVEAPLVVEHDEKEAKKPSEEYTESVPTEVSEVVPTIAIFDMDSLYIFPSDTTLLQDKDLEGKSYDTLNKAYNEIFARHGHDFQSAELKRYFSSKSWYNPTKDKVVSVSELTDVESKNLQKIKQKIDEIKR